MPILLGTVQKWKGDGVNCKYETIKETMIYVLCSFAFKLGSFTKRQPDHVSGI